MTGFPDDLLAAVPMPLILIGPDERIRAMNPRAAEMFSAQGVGRHYLTVLRQPGLLALVEPALSSGVTGTARYVDRKLTREATYRVQAAPLSLIPCLSQIILTEQRR